MILEQHEQTSLDLFDDPGTEIHKFLDQYYSKYRDQHRVIYHHVNGIVEVKRRFKNEICVNIATRHIIDDVGILSTNFNFYGSPFFLNPDLYEKLGNDLIRIYGSKLELVEYLDAYL